MGNFVLQERLSKAKHLQTIAGVQSATYWISTFMWDTVNYQMPFLATGRNRLIFLRTLFCCDSYVSIRRLYSSISCAHVCVWCRHFHNNGKKYSRRRCCVALLFWPCRCVFRVLRLLFLHICQPLQYLHYYNWLLGRPGGTNRHVYATSHWF